MPFRIIPDAPARPMGNASIFQAEDDHGTLEVWITRDRWTALWEVAETVGGRDYVQAAVRAFEDLASKQTPVLTAEGARLVFIG